MIFDPVLESPIEKHMRCKEARARRRSKVIAVGVAGFTMVVLGILVLVTGGLIADDSGAERMDIRVAVAGVWLVGLGAPVAFLAGFASVEIGE